jgi:hypothetical protein
MNFFSLLTGGFLKGYRSYLITGVACLTIAVAWADGDMTGMQALPAMLTALGVTTAANH